MWRGNTPLFLLCRSGGYAVERDVRCGFGVVAVVVTHPVTHVGSGACFIASYWGEIDEGIGSDEDFAATSIGGIGVEDAAFGTLIEDA